MMAIFLLLSALALVGGLLSLSNATLGVGGIAVACLLAIVARIAQASDYHKDLLRTIRESSTVPEPPPVAK